MKKSLRWAVGPKRGGKLAPGCKGRIMLGRMQSSLLRDRLEDMGRWPGACGVTLVDSG